MRRLGSVQQKIPCVFLTDVREEPSRKRYCESFQIVATETVNPLALEANIHSAVATEKVDGTCCYVTLYQGEPYLWARLDRKPTKQAEKRFKRHRRSQQSCEEFSWNVEEDFKSVPEAWIPAHRVKRHDGHPVPDEHGHTPGWVPVEKSNKQYCWHASAVDYEARAALVLRPSAGDENMLEITAVPLDDLQEQTLELIGTNVNANPYKLGSKKQPVHCLVPHGSIVLRKPPAVDFQQLLCWFQEALEGQVEGIVWHCGDGTLIKVHRHHLGLKWPDGDPRLSNRPVVVRVEGHSRHSGCLFALFSTLNGRGFSRLQDVQFDLPES
ncbi:uncharacterized protein C12orf29 homolog isoform X1 [Oryzias latipes]|uniref:RNA ligase 1 n=1 Tax=Oryzias latipes TaxID=8090 RepID=H2N072_ORYLA|nr:uncharacterized protein C12orf29 homolog isoform X1 [Oryzias latipes]